MFIFPKLQSPIMWINNMTDGCSTMDCVAGAMVQYPENYMVWVRLIEGIEMKK
jgi:hypothetical protein